MAIYTQDLCGVCERRIGEGAWEKITVPYSSLPVGQSACRLYFDRESTAPCSILVLEGITYSAEVVLNGSSIGKMLPYCEYRYDVSGLLKEKGNELIVRLEDISPVFGPSEGWENYGGIIRPVYLLYSGSDRIEDVVWKTELSEDLSASTASIHVDSALPSPLATIAYTLTDPSGKICSSGEITHKDVELFLEHPFLWSPKHPYLYTLIITVSVEGKLSDKTEQKVGFKSFVTKGKRFYLNGEPLFLVGVCRHDLWGDEGHTLTEEQMRQDMQLIKGQGINYVRLVHYPHNRRILDLADELGLLISEEPGLWWSDMHNETICHDSLEILKRTVIRDRSHVCVAFWLSFNECVFTAEFIRDSARVCRENDPTRMVSGANCMSIEMTKQYFVENGFDFYTMHPYSDNPSRLWPSVTELTDKPVLFTEWGGYMVWQNEDLFARYIQDMIKMWRNPEDKPVLAGAALWCWADIYEFSRMEPACRNGILCEGLTDIYRRPHHHFFVFKREFDKLYQNPAPEYKLQISRDLREGSWAPISMPEQSPEDHTIKHMQALCQQPVERYYYDSKRLRHIKAGPLMQPAPLPSGCCPKPVVVSESLLQIPVEGCGKQLRIFGNVSMPYGYPISGRYGDLVGSYTVLYEDGIKETVNLRNGYEITTAFSRMGPSRIEPVAANAPRAIAFSYDYDSEAYVINRFDIRLRNALVKSVIVNVCDPQYCLLIYGMALDISGRAE